MNNALLESQQEKSLSAIQRNKRAFFKKKKNRQGEVVSVVQILDREFWKIDAITQRTLNQRNFIT